MDIISHRLAHDGFQKLFSAIPCHFQKDVLSFQKAQPLLDLPKKLVDR